MKPGGSFLGLFLLLGDFLVLLSDLVELSHVLLEVRTFLQGNEQLCFLAIPSGSLDSNGLSFDFLESSIVISISQISFKRYDQYLTRFSAAITLVETAFPRAWNSTVSCYSRYLLPKKTQKLGFFFVDTLIWLVSDAPLVSIADPLLIIYIIYISLNTQQIIFLIQ